MWEEPAPFYPGWDGKRETGKARTKSLMLLGRVNTSQVSSPDGKPPVCFPIYSTPLIHSFNPPCLGAWGRELDAGEEDDIAGLIELKKLCPLHPVFFSCAMIPKLRASRYSEHCSHVTPGNRVLLPSHRKLGWQRPKR